MCRGSPVPDDLVPGGRGRPGTRSRRRADTSRPTPAARRDGSPTAMAAMRVETLTVSPPPLRVPPAWEGAEALTMGRSGHGRSSAWRFPCRCDPSSVRCGPGGATSSGSGAEGPPGRARVTRGALGPDTTTLEAETMKGAGAMPSPTTMTATREPVHGGRLMCHAHEVSFEAGARLLCFAPYLRRLGAEVTSPHGPGSSTPRRSGRCAPRTPSPAGRSPSRSGAWAPSRCTSPGSGHSASAPLLQAVLRRAPGL